jgi:hypothetical protein
MLRLARLENFRAFDKVSIELAPLTVVMGANSTGKSSILHALILLKQSLRGGDYRVPLTFGGPLLDLGRFQEVLWQGKGTLSFHLEWDTKQGIEFRVAPRQKTGLSSVKEDFRFQFHDKWYRLQDRDEVTPWYFSYEFSHPETGLSLFPNSEPESPRALREVNATITDFFARLRFVGPLRESSRGISFSGEVPESIGPGAKYLIPFLKFRPDVTERVSNWLQERNLAAGLEVRETARGSGRWAAYLLEKVGRRVNLADTGFGYSQLIPVLAELYGAPEGGLILIEQPELHLNPRLAVWMGDVLLAAAQENKTILVETHSEHILLRLRRRVAEEEFSADRLALYFARRSLEEGKSYLQPIKLDETGQPVDRWPEGFWGEDYDEAFQLAKATMKLRRERQ